MSALKTVLLADDEDNLRTLVSVTLEDPGYRILEAQDGPSALAIAREERPDLLVLDWMMPGMTGIEVAKTVIEEGAAKPGRIILLTAKGQDKDREEAAALGIWNYVVKPFSPRELLEKVDEILKSNGPEEPRRGHA